MKNTIYLTLNYTKVKNIMISSFKSFFLKEGFCVEKRNRFCCCCRGGGAVAFLSGFGLDGVADFKRAWSHDTSLPRALLIPYH